MVATGSFWLIQEAFGCYRKALVAIGRYWLLQEAAGCYSKLLVVLVVPVRLFLWQSHKTLEVAECYKKSQEGKRKYRMNIAGSLGPTSFVEL